MATHYKQSSAVVGLWESGIDGGCIPGVRAGFWVLRVVVI